MRQSPPGEGQGEGIPPFGPLLSLLLLLILIPTTAAHALTQTFAATKDAYVWSAAPTNNIGATTTAEVGRTLPKSGPVLLKRALLHFDISTLPANVTLSAATLRLSVDRTSADPLGLGLTAWRLSSDFVEGDNSSGVTWDTQPAVEASPTNTATMSTAAGAWFEMDLTAVVAAERASADPSTVAIRVAPTDETTVELRDFAFRTRENGSGDQRAQLVLEYLLPTPTFTPTPVPPPTSTPSATPTATATATVTATSTATVTATATESGLPPDPMDAAPPLNLTIATTIGAAAEFLYTGPDPIQTGVVPGTIDPRRVAVLRGVVQRRDGQPVQGATISVLNHPEFGSTRTRADGMFDLVVNGGGPLTVEYAQSGLIPVQRQVDVPWQDYVWLPDVVMIPYDAQSSTIDLSLATPFQVAQGSVVTDGDGTRRATLLFPAGTAADLVVNGVPIPVTTLTVRATEFTVDTTGPNAMPADLPPTTGYTYAAELSADEASAATRVQFRNHPVLFYLENFLALPVGGNVPAGYYDRQQGVWVPMDNGRIIKIVGIDGSRALIDLTGDDIPDDPSTVGISEDERAQLLSPPLSYAVGQSLWRVPLTHFTSIDLNWAFGPSGSGDAPKQDLAAANDRRDDQPDRECGSVIESQNQVVGESVPVLGTPFRLHYQSLRVPGGPAFRVTIPLTGDNIPAGLQYVDLAVFVAGRKFESTYAADPNRTVPFEWDGRDGYGRLVQGAQPMRIRIGYVYEGEYWPSPDLLLAAFMRYAGTPVRLDESRIEFTVYQILYTEIGGWSASGADLGGWDLDVHHSYDPRARVLHLGDGRRKSAAAIGTTISTIAGTGTAGFGGDNGPATSAAMREPRAIAVGPQGNVYFADYLNSRVRRITPSGTISTVAGNGSFGVSGDGGPATSAAVGFPEAVAVGPDGSFYVSCVAPSRVRRVAPNGVITTVAGSSSTGFGGDNGLATSAFLSGVIRGLAVGPDGVITTIAGTGTAGYGGDGGMASGAQLNAPHGIAVADDGTVYIADTGNNRVRRIGREGRISTVAGNGSSGTGGDGGAATGAALDAPRGIALGPDGRLYIATEYRIRVVDLDGTINTVAGQVTPGFAGDGGLPLQATLANPFGVAIGPDGGLVIADTSNQRIRRIDGTLPWLADSDVLVPDEDGRQVYVFDAAGRHQQTVHALTGGVLYTFGYDADGRLATVSDADQRVTTIHRNASGTPQSIEAPYGQVSELTFDAAGYLHEVTQAGKTITLTHSSSGLLTAMTDRKNNTAQLTFDLASGRLGLDADAAGGSKAMTRTRDAYQHEVTVTTGEGRARRYKVERLPGGVIRRTNTSAANLAGIRVQNPDGSSSATEANGSTRSASLRADPRFGMRAAIPIEDLNTPSGLSFDLNRSRSVSSPNPANPFAFTSLTDTVSINGRAFQSVFDAATRTFTETSPEGRQTLRTVDAQGRVVMSQVGSLAPGTSTYAGGQLQSTSQGSGAETRTTTYTYNAQGLVETITNPLSQVTRFEYDALGRVTKQILPDLREIGYDYDANGNRTSVTPPGRPAHGFDYTAVNLQQEYTPPQPSPPLAEPRTLYAYNLDRQIDLITRPDGTTIDFAYDTAGRLASVAFPSATVARTYDPQSGALQTLTRGSETVTLGFDGPLLKDETWTGPIAGVVSRTYDDSFRITGQSLNGGLPIAFGYDGDGLLTSAGDLTLTHDASTGLLTGSSLGLMTDAITPNAFGEVDLYSAAYDGTELYRADYARDALGRITDKTETIGGVTTSYQYDYDLAGRLTDVSRTSAPPAPLAHYDYDANGNRTGGFSQALGTIVPAGTSYDAQDRLLTYETTLLGPATYAYTADGMLLSRSDASGTTTYTYDALGNLLAVTPPSGPAIEYIVDGQNRRIGKKVGGTLVQGFLYLDDLRPIAELDGSGAVVSRFVYGAKTNVPDYLIKGGVTYRIVSDHLGSPRLIVNLDDGSIAQRLDYDEFGNVLLDTNPGFQPFGFAGGLCDATTAVLRFGARDYDSTTGRWRSQDPIGFRGGPNLYGYVLHDPINRHDPSGLTWRTNLAFLLEFFTGGGATNRNYGPGDVEMQEMQASLGAEGLREAFRGSGCVGVRRFAYGTGEAYWDTLGNPSTADWSSTAAQVGGFDGATAVNNGNGTVTYRIVNVAGAESFFYHLVPNRTGLTGPFRTITQTFQWTEDSNCECRE